MMAFRIFGKTIDERFFTHRLRSTSIGGISGAIVAAGLFLYRMYIDKIIVWDLLAVVATMAVVKMSLMVWYHLKD